MRVGARSPTWRQANKELTATDLATKIQAHAMEKGKPYTGPQQDSEEEGLSDKA